MKLIHELLAVCLGLLVTTTCLGDSTSPSELTLIDPLPDVTKNCVANTWGKEVSLISEYANGNQLFVFPEQQNKLLAKMPFYPFEPNYGLYQVTVYSDCTVSFVSKGNNKFVAMWENTTAQSYYLAANREEKGRRSRYEVIDNQDGTYRFKSVEFKNFILAESNFNLNATQPNVTNPINTGNYYKAMAFRVIPHGYSEPVPISEMTDTTANDTDILTLARSVNTTNVKEGGGCKINGGVNGGKTGTYDTTTDPGHTWCCTKVNGGGDCTECTSNGQGKCSATSIKLPGLPIKDILSPSTGLILK